MKLLNDLDVSGKGVILRGDLDIPIKSAKDQVSASQGAHLEKSTRLTNLKGSVDKLFEKGAKKVEIIGHIGRPEKPEPGYSTQQIVETLKEILGREIVFQETFDDGTDGQLVLFENLRFWSGERDNDMEFAKQLATLGDVYVNDALAASHRNHASIVSLPSLMPHAMGLHLQIEMEQLSKIVKTPERPFVAIVGGAKIETKVPVIENLVGIADIVLVGGELPIEIKRTGKNFGPKAIIAELTENSLDIPDAAVAAFSEKIKNAKTIVWNGPMGLIEEGYTKGSLAIAKVIGASSGAFRLVGGGETTHFLSQNGLLESFSFVSAGGGAMLEVLAGKELPGLKALE